MELKSNYGTDLLPGLKGYIYTGKFKFIDVKKEDLGYNDKYCIQKLLDKTDTEIDEFISTGSLKQIVHTFINTETNQIQDIIGGYVIGNVNIDNKSLILNGAIIKDNSLIIDSIISGVTLISDSKIVDSVITNINSDKLNSTYYTKIINSIVVDSIFKGKHFYITTSTIYCAKISQYIYESASTIYQFRIKSSNVNFSGIPLILKNFFNIDFSNITFTNITDLKYKIEYGITLFANLHLSNMKSKVIPIDFFILNIKDTNLSQIKINGNLYNKIQMELGNENNFSFLMYEYQTVNGELKPVILLFKMLSLHSSNSDMTSLKPVLFTDINEFKRYLLNPAGQITPQEIEIFLSPYIKAKENEIESNKEKFDMYEYRFYFKGQDITDGTLNQVHFNKIVKTKPDKEITERAIFKLDKIAYKICMINSYTNLIPNTKLYKCYVEEVPKVLYHRSPNSISIIS